TRDQMHAYFRRRYVAPNITVAVAGAFAWPELVALVKKHCGGWESGPIGREQINEGEGTGRFEVETRDGSGQEHAMLVAPGATDDSSLRPASSLLSGAVGDEPGSRLYWALVEPGLAESAGCGLDGNEGAGAYYTSFSGEPDQAEENLGIVQGVLEDVQKQGISAEELQQA